MSELKLEAGFKKPEISGLPDGWKFKRLEEFSKFFQGGKLGLTKEYDYVSSGVPAFSAAGQDGYVEKCEFNNSDAVILSAIGANCGRCFYASGDWTTLANVQAIVPESDVIAKYLFFRVSIEGYWTRSGSAQPFIKPSSAKKSWIAYPASALVQSKIVEVLDTIDEAIEQTEALIEKYSLVKAGMMHDLFTRGLTPDGKLRAPREEAPDLYKETPIGWIPADWAYGKFGDNVAVIDPNPSHRYPDEVTEGYPICSTENFSGEDGFDFERSKLVSEKTFQEQNNRCQYKELDVIFARKGRIGFARRYGSDRKAFSHTVVVMKPITPKIDASWLLWLSRSDWLLKAIERRMNTNSGVPTLGVDFIKNIEVPLPSPEEQNAANMVLETASRRIQIETDRKQKLTLQKAGLMHDLLTGEVSVKIDDVEAAHV